jgi:hypothetical protein
MPRDAEGNFHISGLRPGKDGKLPMGKSGQSEKFAGKVKPALEGEGEASAKHTTLHDHGDGTFHTEYSDGAEEQHPDIGHAVTHMAHLHAPEGKHHHVHHDGMMMHSHGVDEKGEHDGTHDHANMDELRDSMDKFLNEEAAEKGPSEREGGATEPPEEGLSGFRG